MDISYFTDLLLKEYIRINGLSDEETKDIKRIILAGFIPNNILEKRDAARIINLFIRYTKIENEENQWEKAKRLKDLYDCRTCVDHVAQMYVKGIIEPIHNDVFGMRNAVTDKESRRIIEKVFDKTKRNIPD